MRPYSLAARPLAAGAAVLIAGTNKVSDFVPRYSLK